MQMRPKLSHEQPPPVNLTPNCIPILPLVPTQNSNHTPNQDEQRMMVPGVATGLAWSPAGGDVLYVEACKPLTLTLIEDVLYVEACKAEPNA